MSRVSRPFKVVEVGQKHLMLLSSAPLVQLAKCSEETFGYGGNSASIYVVGIYLEREGGKFE